MNRKYTHNYRYFKNIDTHEKAYWLGFIFADGFILNDSNTIGIQIHPKDIEILEAFKIAISATNPIATHDKNSTFGRQTLSRILLCHKDTKNDLMKLGITATKSKDGRLPTVDDDFKWSLLRGYLDGDGYIRIASKNSHSVAFCGTKESLDIVEAYTNEKFVWHERHPDRNNNNYTISMNRKNVESDMIDNIYGTVKHYKFALKRKHDIYLEIKNR